MTPTPDREHDRERDGAHTIEQVYSLMERFRAEVLAEIDKLENKTDVRWEAHSTKHESERTSHQIEHKNDSDHRTGYIRWAVTSILTGLGVLISIYLALRP